MENTDSTKQTATGFTPLSDGPTDPFAVKDVNADEPRPFGSQLDTVQVEQSIEAAKEDAAEDAEDAEDKKADKPEPVIVSVIGEQVPPVTRVDGEDGPTAAPRCQVVGCGGSLHETGRTQATASAGTLGNLQCDDCGATSWWRSSQAWEYVGDALKF